MQKSTLFLEVGVKETAAFSGTVVLNPDASVPSADTTDSCKRSESGPEPMLSGAVTDSAIKEGRDADDHSMPQAPDQG